LVRRGLSKADRRLVWITALVVLGMVCSCGAGYVMRTPLDADEPLTVLIAFEPLVVVRGRDLERLWGEFQKLPRYKEFRATPAGAMFAHNSPLTRAAQRIERRATVLGLQMADLFDVAGEEVVIAVVPGPRGRRTYVVLSRLTARANLLLGLHAALRGARPLPGAPGGAWVVTQHDIGLAWTKMGDVLVMSNNVAALAHVVTSARKTRRVPSALAAALTSDDDPQIAFRPNASTDPAAPVSVLSIRLGPGRGPAAVVEDGPNHAAFRRLACGFMPVGTCVGAIGRADPRRAWEMLLATLPAADADAVGRYVEDDLCAVLDADDFDADVLGRFTGDAAVVMAQTSDAWMTMAAGRSVPTVSLICRIRSDAAFEKRLHHALVEVGATLARQGEGVSTKPVEHEHRGVPIRALRVGRAGMPGAADAGYFVVPDRTAPSHSILVASTSAAWLRRSIDAHDGGRPSLRAQEWLQSMLRPISARSTAFAFARGDRLGAIFQRITGEARRTATDLGQWLALLGHVEMDGQVRPDGSVRGVIRVTGRRLLRRPARKSP
jgi:hypothetical protein